MRFAAYAGTSVALATGTVIRAFYERSNFYSASVAIAQSNASLMILTNVALLGVSMFMLGLQRLFYGPLRPIEIEQLYEKAWFAITETCLAMTIFREEVGGWFMVMFVSLLIGKVWGWIGEGRVEILEQQPPPNPRLFHTQLSLSLSISSLYDFFMLRYAVNTVLRHARPNMMVMFAFEFAVLTVNSLSTAARYGLFIFEANVIRKQIDERRSQVRRDREQAQLGDTRSQALTDETVAGTVTNFEEDVETMDFDAPGWEEKGRWIFYLDLATDFFKLILYLTFFCVLCMFYGMPIHIIRDVALTIRSFHKRIRDFMRYRQATRDMNIRYPDATADEVAREDVCIICRENMRPWPSQQNGQPAANEVTNGTITNSVDERYRPKKLPCGHILHFACLRSWLERQQNCPTCRRPVLVPSPAPRAQAPHLQPQQARTQAPAEPNQAILRAQRGQIGQTGQNPPPPRNVYQFGPIRIAFGARQLPQRPGHNNIPPSIQQAGLPTIDALPRAGEPLSGQISQMNLDPTTTGAQLQQIEQQLMREINSIQMQHDQLFLVRALQGELMRLRLLQTNTRPVPLAPEFGISRNATAIPITQQGVPAFAASQPSQFPVIENRLSTGMTVPTDWTLVPLRRLSANTGFSPEETQPSSDRSAGVEPQTSTIASSGSHGQSETTAFHDETPITEALDLVPPGISRNVTNQPTARDTSGNRSSAYSTAQLRAEPADDTSSQPTPKWGSSAALPETDANANERLIDAADVETSTVGSSSGEIRDKGKGKATTVEDSTEDAD